MHEFDIDYDSISSKQGFKFFLNTYDIVYSETDAISYNGHGLK